MKRLLLGGSLVPLLLLAVTACTGSDRTSEAGSAPAGGGVASTATPFADCATLSTPLPGPTGSSSGAATGGGSGTATGGSTGTATGSSSGGAPEGKAGVGQPLPALTLPCLTGDSRVAVGELRGPAVINLWAHWCAPCRKELPAFQRLAERTSGSLRVLGVNARDSRSRAESVGEDFALRFPTLFDPDDRLRLALGRNVLPITLFVDGEGRIRHRDETGALDDAELATLVRRHLGVAVPS